MTVHIWNDQYNNEDWSKLIESKIVFEENGIDVSWSYLNIEIKPKLSHDYPAILRQMKTQNCNVLFIGGFEAEGITIEQVRKMYHPIIIITIDDIN